MPIMAWTVFYMKPFWASFSTLYSVKIKNHLRKLEIPFFLKVGFAAESLAKN
jgi:hypothetical protein